MKYILETQSPEINIRWTRQPMANIPWLFSSATLADQSAEPILHSESPENPAKIDDVLKKIDEVKA